jgi:hypothetical protein
MTLLKCILITLQSQKMIQTIALNELGHCLFSKSQEVHMFRIINQRVPTRRVSSPRSSEMNSPADHFLRENFSSVFLNVVMKSDDGRTE